MENYVRLFIFCLLLVIATTSNPGFRTKITRQALQYANNVAMDELSRKIRTTAIPNFDGKSGKATYSINNIKVKSFTKPTSSLTPQSNGIRWSASNAGIEMSADFRYSYKLLFRIRDHGSVSVKVGGLNFDVVIKIERLSNGKPRSRAVSCNAHIGSLSVKFHGGRAWIYNLFKGLVARKMKSALQPKICCAINDLINNAGSKALSKLQMTVNLGPKFVLDYSLSSDIIYNSNYVETNHKGEVLWRGSSRHAVVSNPALPAVADNSKMIYFWLSEYAISTLMWQAQNNNFLTYTFTRNDLEPNQRSFLDITCTTPFCAGDLFPKLQEKYPGYHVEIEMRSSFTPKINILAGKIRGELGGEINLYAVKAGASGRQFICKFSVNMSAEATMRVQNELVYGNMKVLSFNLSFNKNSNIPSIPTGFSIALTGVMQKFVDKKVNSVMAAGVPLPVKGKVQLLNPSVQLLPNAAVISSNLKYIP